MSDDWSQELLFELTRLRKEDKMATNSLRIGFLLLSSNLISYFLLPAWVKRLNFGQFMALVGAEDTDTWSYFSVHVLEVLVGILGVGLLLYCGKIKYYNRAFIMSGGKIDVDHFYRTNFSMKGKDDNGLMNKDGRNSNSASGNRGSYYGVINGKDSGSSGDSSNYMSMNSSPVFEGSPLMRSRYSSRNNGDYGSNSFRGLGYNIDNDNFSSARGPTIDPSNYERIPPDQLRHHHHRGYDDNRDSSSSGNTMSSALTYGQSSNGNNHDNSTHTASMMAQLWNSPTWRGYKASPQKDDLDSRRMHSSSSSMKNTVIDAFTNGRPPHFEQQMDKIRTDIYAYMRLQVMALDSKVDEIVNEIIRCEGNAKDSTEYKRVLKYDERSNHSFGQQYYSSITLDDVKNKARTYCPALLRDYNFLSSLFTMGNISRSNHNGSLLHSYDPIIVAQRIRELASSSISGRQGSRSAISRRDTKGVQVSDAAIIMNTFFHKCDSAQVRSPYDVKFSSNYYAPDIETAKQQVNRGNMKVQVGIFSHTDDKLNRSSSSPSYGVYFIDINTHSFTEVRVPEGGKNSDTAIYEFLCRIKGHPSFNHLPRALRILTKDVLSDGRDLMMTNTPYISN
jgi:hypothetical protein